MTIRGETSWPPAGKNSWPLTAHRVELVVDDVATNQALRRGDPLDDLVDEGSDGLVRSVDAPAVRPAMRVSTFALTV